jgi:ketosteroid isomerase-like protein
MFLINSMSDSELNEIAQRWFAAFNNKDLKSLLSLYDDNAEHFSPKLKMRHPETKGLIKGQKAMQSWWQDAFNRLPSLRYTIVRLTPHDNRVFMEYNRHVDGEEDLYVGEMLEIKNGLIIKSSVFHQ